MIYTPYWTHVLSFWNRRNNPNLLFMRYEDIHNDIEGIIRKVSTFLEKPVRNENIPQLAEHLKFDKMKDNSSVNGEYFMDWMRENGIITNIKLNLIRKGQVGASKQEIPGEIQLKFDEWSHKHLKNTDYPYYN